MRSIMLARVNVQCGRTTLRRIYLYDNKPE